MTWPGWINDKIFWWQRLADAVDLVNESESFQLSQRDTLPDSIFTLSLFFCGFVMGVSFSLNSVACANNKYSFGRLNEDLQKKREEILLV